MSDAEGQPEPTMEEILASIRHIISEDGKAAEEAEDDIFELTDFLGAEEPEPLILEDLIEEEPEPKPDFEAVLKHEPETIAKPEHYVSGLVAMDSPESEGLVSRKGGEQTAGAVREFASSASSTQRVQLGASDRTLEELVKELLRPMLKDWLDNNLQPIILRAVESEIAKLAERADED